ncbi:MAG: T9SS type A sorting domain-containing protein [Sphingobacteriales bacterium]|nr:MAG: T9SS type A sorting domain-containing protein [Sphingobacteriales bacterium]
MLQSFTKKAFTAFLLATSAATVTAQTFQPPVATVVTYGDPNIKLPRSTSNHAMAGNASYLPSLGLGVVDLYVAAWNDPDPGALSEVTVMLMNSGGTTPVWQSSIIYKDVQDLEVGSRRNPGSNETTVLVAYYQTGVGHFLDEYKLGAGNVTGLISQTQLSNSTTYGRIQMDFHALWTGAIAWIDPSINAIKTIVYDNNVWSAPTVVNGTANQIDMDIAIEAYTTTAGNSIQEVHLVYSDGGLITESSLDFNTLTFSPPSMWPNVNDVSLAGPTVQSRLTLDCPGFSLNGSRWAYTYSDLSDIIVRFSDPAIAGGATQFTSMTTGALGNVGISGSYKMHSPTLNYEHLPAGGYQNDIMVAWYATDGGGFNNYIALRMDPTGSFYTSAPDYLDLPNAQMPFAPSPFTSGVALNKTDAKTPSSYSYATYYNVDPVTGTNQLHHAFHPWGNSFFRGEAPGPDLAGDSRISTYPNPFNDQLTVSVTTTENSVVELLLTDISGRVAAQTNNAMFKGTHQINMDKLGNLAPGNYILTVLIDQKKAGVQKVTKQ